jgi:hypothetical protein
MRKTLMRFLHQTGQAVHGRTVISNHSMAICERVVESGDLLFFEGGTAID